MLVHNNYNNHTNLNIVNDLQDYMFTSKNLIRFTKHIIKPMDTKLEQVSIKNKQLVHLKQQVQPISSTSNSSNSSNRNDNKTIYKKAETINQYKPKQKDSLFWCFYILKNGYSNYEMEINNQYFVIEKQEKFKYIDIMRRSKELLKLHKIKPYTEIEDDLANKDKISVKTFFALCIVEKINILLVDKRKVYENICIDIDDTHPIHVINRNSQTYEHYIELNTTPEILQKYRETYFKMSSFESGLKSIGSYKVDELMDLCKKMDINLEKSSKDVKKKMTKKDIYELLVMNF
jgi:hypothetical protein